ncbi:MAG: hypothetical protein ACREQW_15165 [Candidatus Binatia bacterium]
MSRDNITTWYGKTSKSRIADPADPARIFSKETLQFPAVHPRNGLSTQASARWIGKIWKTFSSFSDTPYLDASNQRRPLRIAKFQRSRVSFD